MKTVDLVAVILLIVGGLNWGLVGLFNLNVVELLFHSVPAVERLVYVAVGVAAVYKLVRHFQCHECCSTKK